MDCRTAPPPDALFKCQFSAQAIVPPRFVSNCFIRHWKIALPRSQSQPVPPREIKAEGLIAKGTFCYPSKARCG